MDCLGTSPINLFPSLAIMDPESSTTMYRIGYFTSPRRRVSCRPVGQWCFLRNSRTKNSSNGSRRTLRWKEAKRVRVSVCIFCGQISWITLGNFLYRIQTVSHCLEECKMARIMNPPVPHIPILLISVVLLLHSRIQEVVKDSTKCIEQTFRSFLHHHVYCTTTSLHVVRKYCFTVPTVLPSTTTTTTTTILHGGFETDEKKKPIIKLKSSPQKR